MQENLPMYMVYEKPSDYPNEYVVRKWFANNGKITIGEVVMRNKKFEPIRDALLNKGLVCTGPYGEDDPKIIAVFL